MTFEQLKYFSVLAETLNYTKAANILFISQPTLSRQIMLLEEEFEAKLFSRAYKSLTLTPAGEIFWVECKRVLLAEKQLRERMSWFQLGTSGALVCASLGMYYPKLQNVFRQFRKAHPDIRLMMQQHDTGDVKELILSGEGDIGICFSFELTPEDNFGVLPLFNEDFRIVVADTHPLATRTSVSVSELKDERMILLGNNQFPFIEDLWNVLQSAGTVSNMIIDRPASLNSILLNIQAGNYISFFPAPMTRTHLDGCVSLTMEDVDSSFQTILIWKKDNDNPALKLLLDDMKSNFGT